MTRARSLHGDERGVRAGLLAGSLRFEVEPVQTWTPMRCNNLKPRQMYFLIRVSDPRGAEIARYAMTQAGHFAMGMKAPRLAEPLARFRSGLPRLPRALSEVARRYGIQGERAQYVYTVAGWTTRCAVVSPCIAFQAGPRSFVLDPSPEGGLFEFSASSAKLSAEKIFETSRKALGGTSDLVDRRTSGLVSIGREWVVTRRVLPK